MVCVDAQIHQHLHKPLLIQQLTPLQTHPPQPLTQISNQFRCRPQNRRRMLPQNTPKIADQIIIVLLEIVVCGKQLVKGRFLVVFAVLEEEAFHEGLVGFGVVEDRFTGAFEFAEGVEQLCHCYECIGEGVFAVEVGERFSRDEAFQIAENPLLSQFLCTLGIHADYLSQH